MKVRSTDQPQGTATVGPANPEAVKRMDTTHDFALHLERVFEVSC